MRHGHLGNVDEHLQIALLPSHGRGSDCRFQVMSRHTHAEIQTSAPRQGPRHILGPGEVADHDLGTGGAQRFGPFIFAMDQRPNRQVALAQHLHNSNRPLRQGGLQHP